MRGVHGLSLGFAAGAIGGLVCSLVIWFSGEIGLTAEYGVRIHPRLTPDFLYPRIVWGGLWGFALMIPYFNRMPEVRGMVMSLLPTAFQLFVVFPIFLNHGVMGARLGEFTPLFVLLYNLCWGVAAGFWLRICRA